MKSAFTPEQMADPAYAESADILRGCVHCGFCTATCPTYQLLGDERDGPRGRIVLIQDMLAKGGAPDPETVHHIDRCLGCLSCMTTCPSGVHYGHLLDHARAHIEAHHPRPWIERSLRQALGLLMTRPRWFGVVMALARPFRGLARSLPGRMGAMAAMIPDQVFGPSPLERPQSLAPQAGPRKLRVALLLGCVQRPLAPHVSEAAARVLTRFGAEVVIPEGLGCCGALEQHLGQTDQAGRRARANLAALKTLGPIDRIVTTASGCGTMLKDYGHVLGGDEEAQTLAAKSADISEVLSDLGYRGTGGADGLKVAYHGACSLEHGQKVKAAPRALLKAAGFQVVEIGEGHLCCGSAGTYNLLQPEIANALRNRKQGHIAKTKADVVAAGNLGCMAQLAPGLAMPIVHLVELLDWASGGPKPGALA